VCCVVGVGGEEWPLEGLEMEMEMERRGEERRGEVLDVALERERLGTSAWLPIQHANPFYLWYSTTNHGPSDPTKKPKSSDKDAR